MTTEPLDRESIQIYDRQIRLWGWKSQKRLMTSNVLIIGLSPINVELAKNLILTGTQLTLFDNRVITEYDVSFNFFLRESDIDKNLKVDEVTARRLKEIHPTIDVSFFSSNANGTNLIYSSSLDIQNHLDSIENTHDLNTFNRKVSDGFVDFMSKDFLENVELIEELIKDYNCVSISAEFCPFFSLITFNEVCRENQKAFFASLNCGKYGMIFSDMKEIITELDDLKNLGNEMKQTKIAFPNLKSMLNSKIDEFMDADPIFLAFSILFQWEKQHYMSESAESLPSELTEEIYSTIVKDFEEYISNFVSRNKPFLPVPFDNLIILCTKVIKSYKRPFQCTSSILGGILTEEIRKYILKGDRTGINCISYNMDTSKCSALRIPR